MLFQMLFLNYAVSQFKHVGIAIVCTKMLYVAKNLWICLNVYLCCFIKQAYSLFIVSRLAYFILYDTYIYLIVNWSALIETYLHKFISFGMALSSVLQAC